MTSGWIAIDPNDNKWEEYQPVAKEPVWKLVSTCPDCGKPLYAKDMGQEPPELADYCICGEFEDEFEDDFLDEDGLCPDCAAELAARDPDLSLEERLFQVIRRLDAAEYDYNELMNELRAR